MNPTPLKKPSRAEGGYVVVITLVLIVTVLTISVTMMNHVVEESQTSSVTSEALSSREVAYSGVQLANQSMKVGLDLDAKTITNGSSQAVVETASVNNLVESIHSQVLDSNGIGATLYAQADKIAYAAASSPNELPFVNATTLTDIMSDPSITKHYYNGQVWLQNTELTGIVIVEDTTAVFFDDVIVNGAIMTEDAISTDPAEDLDMSHVPCAVVMGNLKVIPGDFLPGVSVVMPEGIFTTMTSDANIQIEGDVVAHTFRVPSIGGSILGNICTVAAADIGDIEHTTSSRGDVPWATDLDTGSSWTTNSIAFIPYREDPANLTAITGFADAD